MDNENDEIYSNYPGRGKKENWQSEVAIRAFFMFQQKYYKNADAFMLPTFFVEARKNFTREEVFDMYKEEENAIS